MQSRQTTQFVKSQVIKQQLAYQGKWLGMKLVTYTIGQKINPNYECVFRTTKKSNCRTDGVQIIPIIQYKDKNKKPQVVLISNYRPPVQGFCLQFPSGLVQDDNYEENIKRQLLQETGYVLSRMIQFPLPTLYIDPWKSNQSTIMYLGIINGDDQGHKKQQRLQSSQNIRVFTFDFDKDFPVKLKEFAEKENYLIEGKLWSICAGLMLTTFLN